MASHSKRPASRPARKTASRKTIIKAAPSVISRPTVLCKRTRSRRGRATHTPRDEPASGDAERRDHYRWLPERDAQYELDDEQDGDDGEAEHGRQAHETSRFRPSRRTPVPSREDRAGRQEDQVEAQETDERADGHGARLTSEIPAPLDQTTVGRSPSDPTSQPQSTHDDEFECRRGIRNEVATTR